MSGAAVGRDGRVQTDRWRVLLHAVSFVLGFSLIFILLGVSAGAVRDLVFTYRQPLQVIMGVLLIIFGLHTLGVFQIPFLNMERRLELHPDPRLGYLRSVLIGTGFALGWTPC